VTRAPVITKPPAAVAQPPAIVTPGQIPFAPAYGAGVQPVSIVVPPGGFAGFAQQTPATQAMFQNAGRLGGQRSAAKRRRKRKTTAKKAKRTTRARRASPKRKKARLVKGSAAAKRYMASIRRKRK